MAARTSYGPRRVPLASGIGSEVYITSLALGPHPQRELTLMPRLGDAWPRLGIAAGAFVALGPHPQRELTPMPRLGVTCPQLGMAAGAHAAGAEDGLDFVRTEACLTLEAFQSAIINLKSAMPRAAQPPPPARTDADASPRRRMASARHGRTRSCRQPPRRTGSRRDRGEFHWRAA